MAKISGAVKQAEDITASVREVYRYAPKEMRREVGLIARGQDAVALIRYLAADPGPVHHPIRWKSKKQRAAFFASDGFGRGIPTRRTGNLNRAWSVKVGLGASILVENDQEYASYVQGDDQQPFHVDTGYHTIDDGINKFLPRFEDRTINGWFRVVERLEKRAK